LASSQAATSSEVTPGIRFQSSSTGTPSIWATFVNPSMVAENARALVSRQMTDPFRSFQPSILPAAFADSR
jgi:hypothetical protein